MLKPRTMRSLIAAFLTLGFLLIARPSFGAANESIQNYVYSSEGLTTDVAAGWDLILVVNRAPGIQNMQIYLDGKWLGTRIVSTAIEDYKKDPQGRIVFATTPTGRFHPFHLLEHYHSNHWKQDMPLSIFFLPDMTAFHATDGRKALLALGHRYSAGCVHLAPKDAAELFDLVRENFSHTLIIIEDNPNPPSNL